MLAAALPPAPHVRVLTPAAGRHNALVLAPIGIQRSALLALSLTGFDGDKGACESLALPALLGPPHLELSMYPHVSED